MKDLCKEMSYYKHIKNEFLINWRDESLQNNERSPVKAYALMTGILSQLVGSILIGIFGGKWIDGQLGTFPLFLIVGLLLGLGTGIYAMTRLIRHFYSGE